MKVKNSLTPKSRKGTKIMTNAMKEEAMRFVENYGESVEHEAYDKVLNIAWSKYNRISRILYSKEADNIFQLSAGTKFVKLCDKRHSLRMKIHAIQDIINEVSELRYGKY